MSEGGPHGWTLETLEKYLSGKICTLQTRMEDQDKRNLERFAAKDALQMAVQQAADRAILKAERDSKELREDFSKQANQYMLRGEYSIQHEALARQIAINTNRLTTLEATVAGKKEGMGLSGALIIGGFAILGNVVGLITLLVHVYK